MSSRWYDFGGDTIVRADQYIRLASDLPSQQGWLWSRVPLTATNWEIEFEFKIHGAGNLNGDGFAMWVSKQRAQVGPVFGSVDKFEGFGLFFDTYKNNRPGTVFPYVMLMIGDGNTAYDQGSDGKANEVAGCSARGLRNSNNPTKARLTYFQDKSLALQLQYKSEDTWTECFSITPTESRPLKLPPVSYLGFTAETGELSDHFDIVSVDAKNLYTASGRIPQRPETLKGGRGRRSRKKGSSWSWFFFKIFMFGLVCGGGYFGFTMYRANKRTRF